MMKRKEDFKALKEIYPMKKNTEFQNKSRKKDERWLQNLYMIVYLYRICNHG